ncbi:ribosomal RNA small subunit methyltransferase A [bacterium E08(2017)]|nr:ribosomal RNA small subunit methyltransferase A [bacterium E08(2017)]
MNLASPAEVKKLLEDIGVRPNKVLGQNFLIDRNILNKLISAADVSENDCVLEIGGGLGIVTEELVVKAGSLTVVEKDKKLAHHLLNKYGDNPKVEIIHDDVLKVISRPDWPEKEQDYNKVVANLPYSVGTRLLVDMIQSQSRPQLVVVTVQLEVAERFSAECGAKDYGLLSIWSQMHYNVELVKAVNNTCFWPKPEVTSGILKLELMNEGQPSPETARGVYRLTKHAFSHRRKQMSNILRNCIDDFRIEPEVISEIFEKLGLSVSLRPQNLSVSDWLGLTQAIMEVKGNG